MSLDDAMIGCGGIIPKFNAMIYLTLVSYLYIKMVCYLLSVYYQTGDGIRKLFETQLKRFTWNTDTTGSLNMKIYDFRMNVPRETLMFLFGFWLLLGKFGCL